MMLGKMINTGLLVIIVLICIVGFHKEPKVYVVDYVPDTAPLDTLKPREIWERVEQVIDHVMDLPEVLWDPESWSVRDRQKLDEWLVIFARVEHLIYTQEKRDADKAGD